jgi:hypothetical protein
VTFVTTASSADGDDRSLAELLGGRWGALDASLPAVGFAAGWLIGDRRLPWAIGGAVAVALAVSGWRLARRRQPRAAVLGLTGVLVAALVAARTGRAEDFFLVQLISNVASALAWTVSIWLRRPLLGLIVGALLRQRRTWRQDPVLLAGYKQASWWWVASYVLRTIVFGTLWALGAVLALSVARVALSWPLVVTVVALSWATLRRHLAAHDHPGLRHPRPPARPPGPGAAPGQGSVPQDRGRAVAAATGPSADATNGTVRPTRR